MNATCVLTSTVHALNNLHFRSVISFLHSTDEISGRPRFCSAATESSNNTSSYGIFRSISMIDEGIEPESPAINLTSELDATSGTEYTCLLFAVVYICVFGNKLHACACLMKCSVVAGGVPRFSPTSTPQPPPALAADVSPTQAQYAALITEYAALHAQLAHYHTHTEWAATREAAQALLDAASAAEDWERIGLRGVELQAIDGKKKDLVMSVEAFAEFPTKCTEYSERCKGALEKAAAEGSGRDQLAALVVSAQKLIQSLGQNEPVHTTAGCNAQWFCSLNLAHSWFYSTWPCIHNCRCITTAAIRYIVPCTGAIRRSPGRARRSASRRPTLPRPPRLAPQEGCGLCPQSCSPKPRHQGLRGNQHARVGAGGY